MAALNRFHVPSELHGLIALAERFGISDDLAREQLVKRSPPRELQELKAAVTANEEALDRWLAGPEARGPKFSDEYIAFSAMRMVADYA